MTKVIKRESFLSSLKSSLTWKTVGRLAGLLKHVVIAAALGLSMQLDHFYIAIALIGLFVFTWARILEVMAVPKLVELQKLKDHNKFLSLSGGLFVLALIFSICLGVFLLLCSDIIVQIAIGFDPERKAKLSESFIWFSPVFFLYMPFHYIGSVFRALRRFSIFYQAEFIISVVTLACIFVFKHEPNVLFWSFSLGIIIGFLYLFANYCIYFNPWGNPFSKDVIDVLRVAPGLLVLQGAHYLYILTDRVFITFLSIGSIGAIAYGRTIAFIWEDLVGIKSSFITVFAEANDETTKNKIYNNLFSLTIYIAIPITVFLLTFGKYIISLFLERGLFTASDTNLVYLGLSGFSWSLLPMLVQMPMEQIFQVNTRIDLMVKRKLWGLLVNIILNSLFIFVLGWGIWGIALSTSISFWIVMIYSLIAAAEINLNFKWKRHIAWFCWIISGATITVYILYNFRYESEGLYLLFFKVLLYAVILIVMGAIYPGAESKMVKDVIRRVFKRRARV